MYRTPTATTVALVVLLFWPYPVSADSLTGKVVKITDGDTLYILDANYEQHKIRLAGIDAPERKQAYGLASRKHLASIVAGKQVTSEEPRIALVILRRGREGMTFIPYR